MTLDSSGHETNISSKTKPFGEIAFLEVQARPGSMLAAEESILLCIFRDDMQRNFKQQLVNENAFMHALGALVVNSLRANYARLDQSASEGSVGQDLSLEVARAGWTYDTADFVYTKKTKNVKERTTSKMGNLDARVQSMMKQQALNATILSSTAYSNVEKVILIKSCKLFQSASDRALSEVADMVKMIRLPPGVLLYKEGTPGYDSFIIASGQVKLTKNDKLIGLRQRGAINGATCLISAGDPRSATVTTTRDTLVMNITYDEFDAVMQREPELRSGMMVRLMITTQIRSHLLTHNYFHYS